MIIPFLLGFSIACGIWACVFFWLDARNRKPKRHLYSELKEGMDELASTRREPPHHRKHRDAAERRLSREADMAEVGGIEYRFLGATGEEK
jgi:hypothetical protein